MSYPLKGLKVTITSGPTYEPIDPVRFIGNYSSGKMGLALANAFSEAGAEVKVVAGPVGFDYPTETIKVETAEEMYAAVMEEGLPCDIFVAAAAVADMRPATFSKAKIKKDKLDQIKLVKNTDILHSVAVSPERPQLVVGFAAENENHLNNAREKLTNKSCDLIVLNDTGALGQDNNEVWLLGVGLERKLPRASKTEVAKEIVKQLGELWSTST